MSDYRDLLSVRVPVLVDDLASVLEWARKHYGANRCVVRWSADFEQIVIAVPEERTDE